MTAATRESLRGVARHKRNVEAGFLLLAWILSVGLHLMVQFAGSPTIPTTVWWLAGSMAFLIVTVHLLVRRLAPNANPVLLPGAVLLTGIGFSMVSRIDPDLADAQSLWIVIGILAFGSTLFFLRDYRDLDQWRYTSVLIALALLLSPLLPVIGREINGSRLWIRLGPLNFQPVELAKILLVIFFASYFTEKRELLGIPTRRIGRMGVPDLKHFGPVLAVFGFSLFVLVVENDLGQSLLIFATFLVLLYMATARAVYSLLGMTLFLAGTYFAFLSFDRVRVRFDGWLDPLNPETIQDQTFQIAQSLFALASGGLFGMGPGLGRPENIPEASSDFIFAVIGQEIGLVGAVAVILLYVLVTVAGIRTALRCDEPFGKLLAGGLSSLVGIQAFIIIGGVTQLIPLTGITLPFVSYGGSSILANFIILAIILSVDDQHLAGPRGRGLLMRRKPLDIGRVVTSGGAVAGGSPA